VGRIELPQRYVYVSSISNGQWQYIVDAKRDKVAATQLAVDYEIEQGQVRAVFQVQPGSNGPHMTQPQWRFRAG
jgi:hypothetical protein